MTEGGREEVVFFAFQNLSVLCVFAVKNEYNTEEALRARRNILAISFRE